VAVSCLLYVIECTVLQLFLFVSDYLIFLSAENVFIKEELNIPMIHKVVHVNENHIQVLTIWPLLIICPFHCVVSSIISCTASVLIPVPSYPLHK